MVCSNCPISTVRVRCVRAHSQLFLSATGRSCKARARRVSATARPTAVACRKARPEFSELAHIEAVIFNDDRAGSAIVAVLDDMQRYVMSPVFPFSPVHWSLHPVPPPGRREGYLEKPVSARIINLCVKSAIGRGRCSYAESRRFAQDQTDVARQGRPRRSRTST